MKRMLTGVAVIAVMTTMVACNSKLRSGGSEIPTSRGGETNAVRSELSAASERENHPIEKDLMSISQNSDEEYGYPEGEDYEGQSEETEESDAWDDESGTDEQEENSDDESDKESEEEDDDEGYSDDDDEEESSEEW